MQKQPIYVRLVVTLRNRRQFALPPVTLGEAQKYHAELLRDGLRQYDRDGRLLHTPSSAFVAFDYIPCDRQTSL